MSGQPGSDRAAASCRRTASTFVSRGTARPRAGNGNAGIGADGAPGLPVARSSLRVSLSRTRAVRKGAADLDNGERFVPGMDPGGSRAWRSRETTMVSDGLGDGKRALVAAQRGTSSDGRTVVVPAGRFCLLAGASVHAARRAGPELGALAGA